MFCISLESARNTTRKLRREVEWNWESWMHQCQSPYLIDLQFRTVYKYIYILHYIAMLTRRVATFTSEPFPRRRGCLRTFDFCRQERPKITVWAASTNLVWRPQHGTWQNKAILCNFAMTLQEVQYWDVLRTCMVGASVLSLPRMVANNGWAWSLEKYVVDRSCRDSLDTVWLPGRRVFALFLMLF